MAADKTSATEPEYIDSESVENETRPDEIVERETEILTLQSGTDLDEAEEFDPGDIVEAAEQLLRESAPHDFQVLVIGGGPGGYEAALRAAELGAQVALVEAEDIGGAFLQEFVPAHYLLEASRYAHHQQLPLDNVALRDGADALAEKLCDEMREELAASGVTLLSGRAKFVEEHGIEIISPSETRRVKAVHVIIAVGARANRDVFPGDTLPAVIEPRDLLQRTMAPANLVVIGADAVGVELAYLFRMLGSQVTLLEASPEILPAADSDIRRKMAQVLHDCGIAMETFTHIHNAQQTATGVALSFISGTQEHVIEADAVLLAADYGVDARAMELHTIGLDIKDGKILVDEDFQTNINGVYAIGGCVHGPSGPQLARSQGRQAVEYALDYPARTNPFHIPWCCMTQPAAAAVGITEDIASWAGVLCRVGKRHLHRVSAPGESDDGFVKVVIDAESRRLLGCHVVGDGANELINVVTAAMDAGQTVDEMAATAYTESSLGPELRAAIRTAR